MKKTYTKTFDFGKVAYNGTNKTNLVRLDVELKIENGEAIFSASGEVWQSNMRDIEMGGQCIDTIYSDFRGQLENRKLFEAIMGLWERNHLNDMHPDCIHQRKAGLAKKELSITELRLDYSKAGKRQSEIEKKALESIKTTGTATITPEEQKLINLPYSLTVPTEEVENYPLYKVEKTETKTAGWVSVDEHPEGQLSKPCEVCGYKYGSAWVYEPIEKADLAEMMNILSVPLEDRNTIIKLGRE